MRLAVMAVAVLSFIDYAHNNDHAYAANAVFSAGAAFVSTFAAVAL